MLSPPYHLLIKTQLEFKHSDGQVFTMNMSYVEDNIDITVLDDNKLCVLGVEKAGNILSVAVSCYNFDLVGRTDILLC